MINEAKTERGFTIYGTVIDSKGIEVRVQQSSAAFEDAIWIFCQGMPGYEEPSPHLNKAQVKEFIELLQYVHDQMAEPTPDDDMEEIEE